MISSSISSCNNSSSSNNSSSINSSSNNNTNTNSVDEIDEVVSNFTCVTLSEDDRSDKMDENSNTDTDRTDLALISDSHVVNTKEADTEIIQSNANHSNEQVVVLNNRNSDTGTNFRFNLSFGRRLNLLEKWGIEVQVSS